MYIMRIHSFLHLRKDQIGKVKGLEDYSEERAEHFFKALHFLYCWTLNNQKVPEKTLLENLS